MCNTMQVLHICISRLTIDTKLVYKDQFENRVIVDKRLKASFDTLCSSIESVGSDLVLYDDNNK